MQTLEKSIALPPKVSTHKDIESMSTVKKVIDGNRFTKKKSLIPLKVSTKWPAVEPLICSVYPILMRGF